MHITRKLVTIAAVPTALVLGAAGAYAATSSSSPIDSSGVIHGCYSTKASHDSHTITLQNAGTGCPRGTTAVTWNQKGATGPAGARGPAGATTAGPAGLNVTIVEASSAPGGTSAEVVCPSSHPYALGGGGGANSDTGLLSASNPSTVGGIPGGWYVRSTNAGKAEVVAYAVCARL
jgi:hypothetical protein